MDEGEAQEGEETVPASVEEAPSEAPEQPSEAAEQPSAAAEQAAAGEQASAAAGEEAPSETVAEETVAEEKATTEAPTEAPTEGVTEGATEAGTEATTEDKTPGDIKDRTASAEKPPATASEVRIDEKDRRRSSVRMSVSRQLAKVTSSRMSRTRDMALGSTISFKKSSTLEMMEKGKIPRYMNTYKLWSDNPFNAEVVHKILVEIVDETIVKLIYEPDKVPKLAKWASGAIRTKVKELNFDRYKLVCLVTIGEKRSQDMLTFVRFLWDLERDRFAYYAAENPGTFMLAMCFGLYFE